LLTAVLAAAAGVAHVALPSRPPNPRLSEQATATVHIVAGARIKSSERPEAAMVTEVKLSDGQGLARTARLIEFP